MSPPAYKVKKLIASLLLLSSSYVFADTNSIDVNRLYDETNSVKITELIDVQDKQIKVDKCIDEYIRKQSKSYAKDAQNDLYDLMNNFSRIASKVYGKKPSQDGVSYTEKIEALARVQCEAYYTMGVLK